MRLQVRFFTDVLTVDRWNDESQDNTPCGEIRMVDLRHGDRHAKNDGNDGSPPPEGNSGILSHETGVDIELGGSPEGSHNVIPVEKVDMSQHAGDGSEGKTVDKSKGRGQIWW